MSDHFLGVLRGTNNDPVKVVRGSSTAGSTYLELRIPDAGNFTRLEVINGVERILRELENSGNAPDGSNFPPL